VAYPGVAFLAGHRDLGTHLGAFRGAFHLEEVHRVPCLGETFLVEGRP
jgi:hypothetical protein